MQLSAIFLARTLLYVDTNELNPRGKAYYPNIVQKIVEKCGFRKFPQKLEDFDEDKGVEFLGGRWDDTTIEAMKIFKNGLMLDTRNSTAESQRILEEALLWAVAAFGLTYDPKMITRRGYVSQFTFHTDVPILGARNSPIEKLAQRSNEIVGQITGDKTPWQPTEVTLHAESFPKKPFFAAFKIQRRVEVAFSENKYWTEAPLPTDVHIELLEKLEADVRASLV